MTTTVDNRLKPLVRAIRISSFVVWVGVMGNGAGELAEKLLVAAGLSESFLLRRVKIKHRRRIFGFSQNSALCGIAKQGRLLLLPCVDLAKRVFPIDALFEVERRQNGVGCFHCTLNLAELLTIIIIDEFHGHLKLFLFLSFLLQHTHPTSPYT